MEKQQKAFHVDAQGNLLNKKGNVVKKAGEFKLEGGYYVDSNGERIKRDIDKTKEKINEKVGQTKEKLSDRKIIERAKGIIMQQKNLTEADAYGQMRKSAMNKGQSMAELSKHIISVFDLLD